MPSTSHKQSAIIVLFLTRDRRIIKSRERVRTRFPQLNILRPSTPEPEGILVKLAQGRLLETPGEGLHPGNGVTGCSGRYQSNGCSAGLRTWPRGCYAPATARVAVCLVVRAGFAL